MKLTYISRLRNLSMDNAPSADVEDALYMAGERDARYPVPALQTYVAIWPRDVQIQVMDRVWRLVFWSSLDY